MTYPKTISYKCTSKHIHYIKDIMNVLYHNSKLQKHIKFTKLSFLPVEIHTTQLVTPFLNKIPLQFTYTIFQVFDESS